jgi:DNA replication protein DnaC
MSQATSQPQLIAESMTNLSLSESKSSPRTRRREMLEEAFDVFNSTLAPVAHWSPEMKTARWARYAHETKVLFDTSGVPDRFREMDLYKLDLQRLPKGYLELAGVLRGLIERPQLMAVGGDRGLGKSALACGLVRAFCDLYRSSLYRRIADVFDELDAATWERKAEIRVAYSRPALLILDEVQVRDPNKAWQDNALTTLIDRRYADGLATVLLSNLKPAALVENLGESVHRRLDEEGGVYEADWPRIHELLESQKQS